MVNNFSFVGYVLNWPCNKTSPAGPVPCILHGMGVAVGTSQPVVHTLAPTLAHAQASNPNKEMVNNFWLEGGVYFKTRW